MKKHIFAAMAALMLGCQPLAAQTDQVVKELNEKGEWEPYTYHLSSDERTQTVLDRVGSYSQNSMENILEEMNEDCQRAQRLVDAFSDIMGKAKGKKAQKRLAKHFTDVAAAQRSHQTATDVLRRSSMIKGAIEYEQRFRDKAAMPAGALRSFHYMVSNGFAGFSDEVTLKRSKEGQGATLTYAIRRMRMAEDEKDEGPQTIAVADTVLQRVRDIVEQGRLYQVQRHYMSEYDITDADSWSMDIDFEGRGNISSGGYAARPDHADALSDILRYLRGVFDAATKTGESESKP